MPKTGEKDSDRRSRMIEKLDRAPPLQRRRGDKKGFTGWDPPTYQRLLGDNQMHDSPNAGGAYGRKK
jgi:hypothetical protein